MRRSRCGWGYVLRFLCAVDEVGNQLVPKQLERSGIAKERGFVGGDSFNDLAAEFAAGVCPRLIEEFGEIGGAGFG
jgi:hypothetical protein